MGTATRITTCEHCDGAGEVDIGPCDIAICSACDGGGNIVLVCNRCDRPVCGVDEFGDAAFNGDREWLQQQLDESLPHVHTVADWCEQLVGALGAIDRCNERGHCDACEREDAAEAATQEAAE